MNTDFKHYLKRGELWLQFFFWAFYIITALFGLGTMWDSYELSHQIMFFVSIPIVFNLNLFYFIPVFLKEKKWIQHIVLICLLSILLESIRSLLYLYLHEEGIQNFARVFYLNPIGGDKLSGPIFLALVFSYAYRFTRDWIINLSLIERLKAEKLRAELAYLKTQVDPHFLFNTLNSLYALALEEKSSATADSIVKLSSLMRYNLQDLGEDKIALEKELDYLKNYIALQALRLSDKTTLSISIDSDRERKLKISPMLLIVFIENAFKYGLSSSEESFIHVHISTEGRKLLLKVQNHIVSRKANLEQNGIGLANVKQRLALLYKEKHRLKIREEKSEFIVSLELDLE